MRIALIIAVAGFTAVRLPAAQVDWSKLPAASTETGVTFDKDIAPIFKASCVRCHSGDRARAQLRLDTLAGVLKGTKQGSILTAGDSANSLLVKAVSQLDPETAMPPKGRGRRGGPGGPGGPMGTNAPAMQPRDGGPGAGGPPPDGGPGAGGPPPNGGPGGPPPMMGGDAGGPGNPPPGGPQGTNGPGQFQQRMRPMGPPPKPLTAAQVGLIRAWIDQGAK